MNDELAASVPSNPFHSGRLRPGAIPFQFPAGVTAERLVDELRRNYWRGAILGPHGSGKTTLLRALEPKLEAAGRRLLRFELHNGQRRLPMALSASNVDPNTIVVVDGYEQLSWLSKLILHARCRQLGCGLLVTAHDRVALPTLFSTRTDPELARAVVRELLAGEPERHGISDEDVDQAFALHSGNIREVLFRLYDVYRQRQTSSTA